MIPLFILRARERLIWTTHRESEREESPPSSSLIFTGRLDLRLPLIWNPSAGTPRCYRRKKKKNTFGCSLTAHTERDYHRVCAQQGHSHRSLMLLLCSRFPRLHKSYRTFRSAIPKCTVMRLTLYSTSSYFSLHSVLCQDICLPVNVPLCLPLCLSAHTKMPQPYCVPPTTGLVVELVALQQHGSLHSLHNAVTRCCGDINP